MLQTIRDRAQGWIAWAIVILISIPFALWGIQEYLGVGSQPVVANVNDREITEAELDHQYHQFRSELRARLGSAYRPELFDDEQLRKQVLEDMIRNELILQETQKLGLHAGDQLVRSMIMSFPQFRKEGRFDQATYERALRNQRLSSKAFERSIRLRLISNQLSRAIEASEFITERELNDAIRLRDQTRQFSYLILPLAEFMDSDEIHQGDIGAYYNSHQDLFRVPEQVKVEYLTIDAERIGAKLNPDEETLRGWYESNRDQFAQGEQRRASHILVAVAADADEATTQNAEDKIKDILKRIQDGEDFAVLAQETSEDPGSAEAGGDLGMIERGIMDPAFEHAAFSAEVGRVVGPVRTRFGFHLIKVTEIEGGEIPQYEDQRDIVLETYRRDEGERLFYDYAERLSDLAFENPDSLEPAAEALGLEIAVSDWMDRSGGSGVLGIPKVVAAAFSDDVLVQGNNSEAVELGPQHVIVLRTLDHKQADVKPLEEVRADIENRIREEHAADKASERGEALLKRLLAGETLEKIAAETDHKLEQSNYVRRDDSKLPVSLVSAAFKLAKPAQGQATFGTVVLDNQDFALVALTGVSEGNVSDLEASTLKNEQTVLRRSRGRTYFEHLVDNMRTKAAVEIP